MEIIPCFKIVLILLIAAIIIILIPIIFLKTQFKYEYYLGSQFLFENHNSYPILDITSPINNICPILFSVLPLGKSLEVYNYLDLNRYCITRNGKIEFTTSFSGNDTKNKSCASFSFKNSMPRTFLKWKSEYICIKYYPYNYLALKRVPGDTSCPLNFKSCGILDTLNNILCIPEGDTCPINYINILPKGTPNPDSAYLQLVEFQNFNLLFSNQIEKSLLSSSLELKKKRVVANFKATLGQICALPHEKNFIGNDVKILFNGNEYFNNCKNTIDGLQYNPYVNFIDLDMPVNFESNNQIYSIRNLPISISDNQVYNLYYMKLIIFKLLRIINKLHI